MIAGIWAAPLQSNERFPPVNLSNMLSYNMLRSRKIAQKFIHENSSEFDASV